MPIAAGSRTCAFQTRQLLVTVDAMYLRDEGARREQGRRASRGWRRGWRQGWTLLDGQAGDAHAAGVHAALAVGRVVPAPPEESERAGMRRRPECSATWLGLGWGWG